MFAKKKIVLDAKKLAQLFQGKTVRWNIEVCEVLKDSSDALAKLLVAECTTIHGFDDPETQVKLTELRDGLYLSAANDGIELAMLRVATAKKDADWLARAIAKGGNRCLVTFLSVT